MVWEKVTLGEVCHIEKGNIGILKATQGAYPLVVLGEERRTHNEYQFDGDAVIIPLVSSTGHGDRSMKRIHFQSGKFSIGSILCAVIPKDSSALSAEFLYRYLDLNKEQELVSRMKGMANVSLSIKSIAEVEIPLPSIQAQKEIVSSFKHLEYKINILSSEQLLQLDFLKKLRQHVLQDAIQGKLVPQDSNDERASKMLERIKADKEQLIREKKIKKDKSLPEISMNDIPFDIPKNWVWCRLGEICVDISYGTSQKAEAYGEIPVLRMGNITSTGEILYSNLKYVKESIPDLPNLFLDDGDLVFNRTNSFELVGKCGVFNRSEKYTLASYLIRVRFSDAINSRYISSYINSKVCRETQIEPDTIQQNGQANFNGSKLAKILTPIPPFPEQKRIVSKIEQLTRLFDELEQSIQKNQKFTQELLHVALKEALEPKG